MKKPSLKRDLISRALIVMDEELEQLSELIRLGRIEEVKKAEESLDALKGILILLGHWKPVREFELSAK